LLLNKFFPIVDMCYSCEDKPDKVVRWCPDGDFWRLFLRPVFSASRVQQVSDLHSKFALRPRHVCVSMADIDSATDEIRRGKKKR